VRGIVLFTVETEDAPFAPEILQRLAQAQSSRRTICHLERVRVVIGAQASGLSFEGGEALWRVPTDSMGEPGDAQAIGTQAMQLVTRLYARVCDCQDTTCDVVFLSADSVCNTASLRLAEVVQRRFVALFSIKVHMMLLQDQLTPFGDARTWHMLQAIRQVNQAPVRFYSSLYMLPWEAGKRENTCATIEALVLVMVIARENPMLVHQPGVNPTWIGTAAVAHLEAPVNEITRQIFQFLVNRFLRDVLEPAVQPGEPALEGATGVDAKARILRDMIGDMGRSHRLMPLVDLYGIMPVHDPTTLLSEKEEMPRPEAAWREIYRIYGDETGNRLKAQLNPNIEQMEAQYADMGKAVTDGLLKQSIALATERNLGFDRLPAVMFALGQRFLADEEKVPAGQMDDPDYRRGPFLSKPVRAAVDIARTRGMYLRSVYNDVRKTYNQRHREVRQRTVERAVANARRYVGDVMVSLANRFRQRCDIQLEQMPSGNFYAVRLAEVYTEWCVRQGEDLKTVTAGDLYAMFTDEILAMPPERAAEALCDELIDRFNRCTQAAVDRIRIHIGQFFKEISFRASLLPSIGVSEDLISQLIDYMDRQITVVPMLFESAGDIAIREPKARAFIFHEVGGDSSYEFGQCARERGINVINDPFESGVKMVVKYANAALDHLLLYLNNQPPEVQG